MVLTDKLTCNGDLCNVDQVTVELAGEWVAEIKTEVVKKLELEGVVVRVRCMRRVRRDNCSMLRQLLPPLLQGQGQEEW